MVALVDIQGGIIAAVNIQEQEEADGLQVLDSKQTHAGILKRAGTSLKKLIKRRKALLKNVSPYFICVATPSATEGQNEIELAPVQELDSVDKNVMAIQACARGRAVRNRMQRLSMMAQWMAAHREFRRVLSRKRSKKAVVLQACKRISCAQTPAS